jgi:hypothetical protein
MQHSKMSKAGQNVSLTANAIKQALGLPLSAEEAKLEQVMQQSEQERSVG